jgi:hypothetical protein
MIARCATSFYIFAALILGVVMWNALLFQNRQGLTADHLRSVLLMTGQGS